MASLGRIEITQPLRRVVLYNEQGGWLHAIWNNLAFVELDDGTMVEWGVLDIRFVEPYSKDTIYEKNPSFKEYQKIIDLMKELSHWKLPEKWDVVGQGARCRRCGEWSNVNSETMCFPCWEKLWCVAHIIE